VRTPAGPLRSDSLGQSRGSDPLDLFAATIPPPFFEDDLGLGPNARAKGGRVRRRNHPLALPVLSPLAVECRAVCPVEASAKGPDRCATPTRTAGGPFPRVDYRPAGVVALDRDRCSTQSETPAPTAIPTTASKRSRARKAQLSLYSPLTTVAAKAQAKTPITASTARSQPEVLRQSSHPRTALEMRGKNSSIWFPSLALVRVDQSVSRTPS
jgi:hypothetical protein